MTEMVILSLVFPFGSFFDMIIYQNYKLIALLLVDAFEFEEPVLQPFYTNFKSMIINIKSLLNKTLKFYEINKS